MRTRTGIRERIQKRVIICHSVGVRAIFGRRVDVLLSRDRYLDYSCNR